MDWRNMMHDIKKDISEMVNILEIIVPSNFKISVRNLGKNCCDFLCAHSDFSPFNERSLQIQSLIEASLNLLKGMCYIYEMYCIKGECNKCPINKYCNTYITDQQKIMEVDSPSFVDLFCGAGGLSLGFRQERYQLSFASDIDPSCVDTYAHNHPETPREHIVQGDIKDIIPTIQDKLRFQDVSVVLGGPPCQGFSMANRQRIIDDPRNRLYKSYIEVVDKLRPQFIVMENVRGMLSAITQIKDNFLEIGYEIEARLINTIDFGVPQKRKRVIIIGNRTGVDNNLIFEELTRYSEKCKPTVLGDAINGLKPLQARRVKNTLDVGSDISGRLIDIANFESNDYQRLINGNENTLLVTNHIARYNNSRDIEIYSRMNPGDRSDDSKIADIMPYKSRNHIFKDKYFKLELDKPCKTITAHMKNDCNMYIHPTQARGLTPREAARVQSYPDSYFFRGAYTKTFMQIGNSVPPLLGKAIAHVLKPFLKINNSNN